MIRPQSLLKLRVECGRQSMIHQNDPRCSEAICHALAGMESDFEPNYLVRKRNQNPSTYRTLLYSESTTYHVQLPGRARVCQT